VEKVTHGENIPGTNENNRGQMVTLFHTYTKSAICTKIRSYSWWFVTLLFCSTAARHNLF